PWPPLGPGPPAETIRPPRPAPHTVVDDEEPRGIVLPLHGGQPRVVRPPEGPRPGALEEGALRPAKPGLGCHPAQLIHGPADLCLLLIPSASSTFNGRPARS